MEPIFYIRKNHLTINESPEIFELVADDDGTTEWFGTDEQLSELIGTNHWKCGQYVQWIGKRVALYSEFPFFDSS